MQSFLAKWNGIEKKFEIPEQSTFLDLKLQIQQIFQLSTCKIVNLKRKLKGPIENFDVLKSDFILNSNQKLLIIGSKQALEKEEQKMKIHDDLLDEEIGYDDIVKNQHAKILKKIPQVWFVKKFSNNEETIKTAKLLCYQGELINLKNMWSADLIPYCKKLAKFAVYGDKYLILQFLQDKNLIDLELCLYLTCKASKYGYVNLFRQLLDKAKSFLDKSPDNMHDTTEKIKWWLQQSFHQSINYGHLRLAKWIFHSERLAPVLESIIQPISKGYERTVRWFARNFKYLINNSDCVLLAMEHQQISVVHILLQECIFDQDSLDYLLFRAVKFNQLECVTLLYAKNANIDMEDGAIVRKAIESDNLPMIQFVVQSMQSKRLPAIWYQDVLSTSKRQEILKHAVDKSNQDIILYLLNVGLVDDLDYSFVHNWTSANIDVLKNVLKKRHTIEQVAEIASTTIGAILLSMFPVDVNRILLDYYLGTDGRHSAKYKSEYENFVHIMDNGLEIDPLL
jgi:hypothetical protein